MSRDTHSRHCSRLMLAVSLAHNISGDASAGHSRTVWSALAEARRCPSGLNATPNTSAGVAGERGADRLAGVGVPQPHRVVVAGRWPGGARRG